jgi:hypothetical protein
VNEQPGQSEESPRPKVRVVIGQREIGEWLEDVKTRQAVNDFSTAQISLRLHPDILRDLDYLADVQVSAEYMGDTHRLFTGVIETARVQEGLLQLNCAAGIQFKDWTIPGLASIGIRAEELVWTIARSSGFAEDALAIDGIDVLPEEEIEVVVPMLGVEVTARLVVGDFEVVSHESIAGALAGRFPASPMLTRFHQARAFILVHKYKSLLFSAEQEALEDAQVVAAWLATRLRYGAASLPNGTVQSFDRKDARALPRISEVVVVRSLESERRWLRVPRFAQSTTNAALPRSRADGLDSPLARELLVRDREALLAFWRAAGSSSQLACVIALWEAIEFYASGISAPKLFSSSELDELREWIPATLSLEKRKRLEEKIDELNSQSLFIRLKEALRRDGVPLTDDEIEVLRRLRKVRNPALHGEGRPEPAEGDLRRGLSIVARILMYKMHSTVKAQHSEGEASCH